MRLRILGPRILVRAYSLPEKIGSIYVPEHVQAQYDGKTWECVRAGGEVARRVGVGGSRGDEIFPVLKEGIDGIPDLELQEDDIIILKSMFRGVWSGPELREHYGFDTWFINAVETHGTRGTYCAIERVLPSRFWKEESEPDSQAA